MSSDTISPNKHVPNAAEYEAHLFVTPYYLSPISSQDKSMRLRIFLFGSLFLFPWSRAACSEVPLSLETNLDTTNDVWCECNGFESCYTCYYAGNNTVYLEEGSKMCCQIGRGRRNHVCDPQGNTSFPLHRTDLACREREGDEPQHRVSVNPKIRCHCRSDGSSYTCLHEGTDIGFRPHHDIFACTNNVGCQSKNESFVWGETSPECGELTQSKEPTFYEGQQKVLTVLSGFASVLSILGSSYIVFAISLRIRKQNHNTRDRILLMMSIVDILFSFSIGLGPLPSPRYAVRMWGAWGNTMSCAAQGFMIHLGVSVVPLYNSSLCIFFLLAVGYQMNQVKIRRLEWLLHGVPLTFGLTTSFLGLAWKLFNTNSQLCWIQPYPYNCLNHGQDCTRWFGNYDVIVFIFSAAVFLAPPLIIFCVCLMFWKVYRMRRDIRRRFGSASVDMKQVTAVGIQSSLYICSFLFSYLPSIVPELMFIFGFRMDKRADFIVHCIHRFLLPLQGFWNCIIFLRPTFTRIRKNSRLGLGGAFLEALKRESTSYRATAVSGGSSRKFNFSNRSGDASNRSFRDRVQGLFRASGTSTTHNDLDKSASHPQEKKGASSSRLFGQEVGRDDSKPSESVQEIQFEEMVEDEPQGSTLQT